jgi:uroporphyrinogen-III synthase
VQIHHLLQIAAEEGLEERVRAALDRVLIASVGPATSEALRDNRIHVDFEPSHPKMGFLVQETAALPANGAPRG